MVVRFGDVRAALHGEGPLPDGWAADAGTRRYVLDHIDRAKGELSWDGATTFGELWEREETTLRVTWRGTVLHTLHGDQLRAWRRVVLARAARRVVKALIIDHRVVSNALINTTQSGHANTMRQHRISGLRCEMLEWLDRVDAILASPVHGTSRESGRPAWLQGSAFSNRNQIVDTIGGYSSLDARKRAQVACMVRALIGLDSWVQDGRFPRSGMDEGDVAHAINMAINSAKPLRRRDGSPGPCGQFAVEHLINEQWRPRAAHEDAMRDIHETHMTAAAAEEVARSAPGTWTLSLARGVVGRTNHANGSRDWWYRKMHIVADDSASSRTYTARSSHGIVARGSSLKEITERIDARFSAKSAIFGPLFSEVER